DDLRLAFCLLWRRALGHHRVYFADGPVERGAGRILKAGPRAETSAADKSKEHNATKHRNLRQSAHCPWMRNKRGLPHAVQREPTNTGWSRDENAEGSALPFRPNRARRELPPAAPCLRFDCLTPLLGFDGGRSVCRTVG